ncbi:MAG: HEPN domain-containing protein, partial [Thermodesulfobacteriota bacterium]
ALPIRQTSTGRLSMKPHEDAKRKVVAEWLRKADADMRVAEHLAAEQSTFPDAIAFHSQQAAEKYLKAFLTWRQVAFPKTHDLEEILDLVETVDKDLSASLRDAITLTPYGVDLRYPGDRPDATIDEAREALELTRNVRTAIHNALKGQA